MFDDPEELLEQLIHPPVMVRRGQSTPETRERYQFLRTKKIGSTWEENGLLYRYGPHGVTAFRVW
jgi:hypothetical protein